MTGPFIGLDPEAVRAMASQLTARAQEIRDIGSRVNVTLENTLWTGPDREKVIAQWRETWLVQLLNIADGLTDAARRATHDAEQQEQTSAN